MADKKKKKIKKPKKAKKISSILARPTLPITFTQYRGKCCVNEEERPANLTSKLLDLLMKKNENVPKVEPKKSMRDIFSKPELPEMKNIEIQTETPTTISADTQTNKRLNASKKLINDLLIYGKEDEYKTFNMKEAEEFISNEREKYNLSAEEFRKKYINMPQKQKQERDIAKMKVGEYEKMFTEKPQEVPIQEVQGVQGVIYRRPKQITNLGNILS